MGIRSTVVRTLDDEDLIVPNGVLAQGTVKNLTLLDDALRVRVAVGVSYSSDLRLVLETLNAVALGFAGRIPDRAPQIQLVDFGASSVDFDVSVWIDDPWGVYRQRSELRLAIWWAFQRAGVVIAFPQLDVHVDGPGAQLPQERVAS